MEDPLFEYSTKLPKLDRRCVSPFFPDDIDDEDDCNALNEETFGADAVEEDWESDHEKLAAEIEGKNALRKDSFFDQPDENHDVDHADYIVERSVKNWVLDDDPAIMSHSNTISKKSVTQTIKSIFSRSSPPPPALISSDLTGSPITEGIWTSPQRQESATTNQLNYLSNSPKSNEPNHEFARAVNVPRHQSPFSSLQLPSVKILSNAKKLEELENDLLHNIKLESPRCALKSGICTLEDVERDIFLKPKAKMLNEVELEVGQFPPPPSPGGTDLPSIPGQQLGAQLPIGTPQSVQPFRTPQPQMRTPMVNKNISLPILSGHSPQFCGLIDVNSPNMQFPHGQQQMPNNNINRNLRMMTQNRQFNGVPVPHPLLNNIRPSVRHPQHVALHRFPSGLLPNDGPAFSQLNLPYGFSAGPVKGNMNSNPNEKGTGPPQDPYAGLMTQKEKEWLIKIQLMQLQSDNPYLDDFYYMSFRMKQMAKEKASQCPYNGARASPKLVLPETGKIEQKQYTPTQYQGSLGKIQVMSVNNPRKMIDKIDKNIEDDEEEKKLANKELRRYRRGLVDIEKLYDILLEYDDIEKKMLALPVEAHEQHIEQRSRLLLKFNENLGLSHASERFLFIMSIRKGKKLITRALPLLDKEQQLEILEVILQNIITILKRDQVDQVLTEMVLDLAALINKLDFLELVKLSHCFEGNSFENSDAWNKIISPVIQSKFGISIIFSMLHRAERLFNSENVSFDVDMEWSKFVLCLYRLMVISPPNSIAVSIPSYPNILNHFQRFSTNDSEYVIVCQKLSEVMSIKKSIKNL